MGEGQVVGWAGSGEGSVWLQGRIRKEEEGMVTKTQRQSQKVGVGRGKTGDRRERDGENRHDETELGWRLRAGEPYLS